MKPRRATPSFVRRSAAWLLPSIVLLAAPSRAESSDTFALRVPGGVLVRATGLPDAAGAGFAFAPATDAEPEPSWVRGLAAPDLSARWDARVLRYLQFYRSDPRGRSLVQRWFRKSGRYAGVIQRALREQGLTEDLIWVALVESGFDPTIRSAAGALGLWQLMPEGARAFGLTVDRTIDERLDPERSTEAAARYLAELHRRFGTWELALAAYNMGDGGLVTALRKYNTNDYWQLSSFESGVPFETAVYVPKIIAMAIVAHNLDAFGIDASQLDPEVVFDSVPVASNVQLRSIATAARLEAHAIEELNPQLRKGRTPAAPGGPWMVRVPAGKGPAVREALAKIAGARPQDKPRDVADKSLPAPEALPLGTNTTFELGAIMVSDDVRDDDVGWPSGVFAGAAVAPIVETPSGLSEAKSAPRGDLARASDAPDERPVVVAGGKKMSVPGRRRVFYRVNPGDTVGGIANRLGVSDGELCRSSSIDPGARLQEGMVLQAFVPEAQDVSRIACLQEKDVHLLEVGSEEFFDFFEALRGRRRTTIIVEPGETWEKIARRLHLTVGQLERINQKSHAEKLVPKQTLIVYVPVGKPVTHETKAASAPSSHAPQASAPTAPAPGRQPITAPRPDDLPPLPEVPARSEPSAKSP
jgi:membrane-bound lytic murein transglycosylase D